MATASLKTSDMDIETELLLAIGRNQSQKAYAELFALVAPRMKGFLIRQGRPADESENIVQDAMLAVWQKAHSYRPELSSARTWMFAIVRNRLIDLRRMAGRESRGRERLKSNTNEDDVSGPCRLERGESRSPPLSQVLRYGQG